MLEKKLKQIRKKELIKNRWYLGRGRNSNVGKWDGKYFQTINLKFNVPVVKFEGYYGKKEGCFQPFMLIDEGETTKPIKRSIPYAREILLKFE